VQQSWRDLVPDAEAHRRAGGRRRYNAARRQRQGQRRYQVYKLYWQLLSHRLLHPWGLGTILAHHFGVSRATICRDLQAMPAYHSLCPRGAFWESMARR
jgi:hypothetical protein